MSIKSVSRCCGKERFDKNLLSDPDPGVTSGDGEPIFRCNQFPASGVPRCQDICLTNYLIEAVPRAIEIT